ncbi:TIM23 complex component [Tulasnella sp. 424]|nr:TIM23 complex component [Tulasnella sp. 424]KAG8981084.1 TIM23 complex component [Tulasnella sp. 425]
MATLLRAPTAQASAVLRHRLASTPSVLLVSQKRWASSTGAPSDVKQSGEGGVKSPAGLPWAQYFKIRKSKRNWEVATTIPSSVLGLVGGITYFGSLESTGPIFGIDPIFVYGAASVGCMGLGWLFGPFIGGSFWRLSHRKSLALIEKRDREFYNHIVKNRVDPSRQSPVNPVPDYYGEKIGSLKQYRQWLRDQARFRRKATLPEE